MASLSLGEGEGGGAGAAPFPGRISPIPALPTAAHGRPLFERTGSTSSADEEGGSGAPAGGAAAHAAGGGGAAAVRARLAQGLAASSSSSSSAAAASASSAASSGAPISGVARGVPTGVGIAGAALSHGAGASLGAGGLGAGGLGARAASRPFLLGGAAPTAVPSLSSPQGRGGIGTAIGGVAGDSARRLSAVGGVGGGGFVPPSPSLAPLRPLSGGPRSASRGSVLGPLSLETEVGVVGSAASSLRGESAMLHSGGQSTLSGPLSQSTLSGPLSAASGGGGGGALAAGGAGDDCSSAGAPASHFALAPLFPGVGSSSSGGSGGGGSGGGSGGAGSRGGGLFGSHVNSSRTDATFPLADSSLRSLASLEELDAPAGEGEGAGTA
jgi:hypothetical protein